MCECDYMHLLVQWIRSSLAISPGAAVDQNKDTSVHTEEMALTPADTQYIYTHHRRDNTFSVPHAPKLNSLTFVLKQDFLIKSENTLLNWCKWPLFHPCTSEWQDCPYYYTAAFQIYECTWNIDLGLNYFIMWER